MKEQNFSLADSNKSRIVKCIQEGVGDDTKSCLHKEGIALEHSNAKNTIKWDCINRNLFEDFNGASLDVQFISRGPWKMTFIFDCTKGIVYTIMRRERYEEIKKEKVKRKHPHYLDALVSMFGDKSMIEEQLCMFEDKSFDGKEIAAVIKNLFNNASIELELIKGYRLILFEENRGELLSVNSCQLNSDLEIVFQENWSQYITHDISTIVEQTEAEDILSDSLSLTNKAKERITESERVVSLKKDKIEKTGEEK